jgi:hypothetical protein
MRSIFYDITSIDIYVHLFILAWKTVVFHILKTWRDNLSSQIHEKPHVIFLIFPFAQAV